MTRKKIFYLILVGIFVGFINGFFGGGGGMICVPAIEKILEIDNKKAHATTIAIILPLSLVSSLFYIFSYELNYMLLLYTSIGVISGGVVGSILLKKLNSKVIRVIFILILIVSGVKMIIG